MAKRKKEEQKRIGKKYKSYSAIMEDLDNLQKGQIMHTICEGKVQHWIVSHTEHVQNRVSVSPHFV